MEVMTKLGRQVALLRLRAAVLHVRDSVEMIRSLSPTGFPPEIDGGEWN